MLQCYNSEITHWIKRENPDCFTSSPGTLKMSEHIDDFFKVNSDGEYSKNQTNCQNTEIPPWFLCKKNINDEIIIL